MSDHSSTEDTFMSYAEFVRDTCRNKGPVFLQRGDGALWGAALEMVAEAGEVLDILTKASRKRGGTLLPSDMKDLMDELSDVLWGVQAMTNALGVTLEDVMLYNTEKLEARAQAARYHGDYI